MNTESNTQEELLLAMDMAVLYGNEAAERYLMSARERRALKAPRQSARRLKWLSEVRRAQ